MITQEDIDAMDELEAREVMWGDERKLLTDRIEQFEQELAGIRVELDPQPSDTWPTNMAVRALQQAYAAEKALSDLLYAVASKCVRNNHLAMVDYRKARKAVEPSRGL